MEYIYDITLHFAPSGEIPVVRVKQGDASTRYIRATVVNGDDIYIPGAEQTILFREEKPDGTCVLLDSSYYDNELGRNLVTLDESGRIVIELTDQTSSCVGLCRCDLCFTAGGDSLSTSPFVMDVWGTPDVTGAAVSSDDFRTLINALNDVGLSSVTGLADMTDVRLTDVQSGDIIVYDISAGKWVNCPPSSFGYLTEASGRTLIEGYGYQTAQQVNILIETYISALDANNVEY